MTWTTHTRTTGRNTYAGVKVSKDERTLSFNALAADLLIDVQALVVMHDGDRVAFEPVPFTDPNGFALHHLGAVAWLGCYGVIRKQGFVRGQAWRLAWEDAAERLLIGEPVDPRPAHRQVWAEIRHNAGSLP